MKEKTLHNSDISGCKENVPDVKTFGDGDLFRLVSKASSDNEGWMKSTKAADVGSDKTRASCDKNRHLRGRTSVKRCFLQARLESILCQLPLGACKAIS